MYKQMYPDIDQTVVFPVAQNRATGKTVAQSRATGKRAVAQNRATGKTVAQNRATGKRAVAQNRATGNNSFWVRETDCISLCRKMVAQHRQERKDNLYFGLLRLTRQRYVDMRHSFSGAPVAKPAQKREGTSIFFRRLYVGVGETMPDKSPP
jgi:hypothetical protein